ncbi:hypothetical protein [Marinobacter salarius]|uniref:hypothetical protein n=1 Tax=Marinobacter salarius TaxID=1420917 RepID=UPI0032EE1239
MTNATPPASLPRQLFTMTWPMLFGVLSLMTFQLVDSAFIGQVMVNNWRGRLACGVAIVTLVASVPGVLLGGRF